MNCVCKDPLAASEAPDAQATSFGSKRHATICASSSAIAVQGCVLQHSVTLPVTRHAGWWPSCSLLLGCTTWMSPAAPAT